MSMSLTVIFLGTPEFAIPSLKALLADEAIEVAGVMTQPDRPSGRGQKLKPPPVKELAEAEGIEVRQPKRLRKEPEMIDWLRSKSPDFLVTAAFGQILSQEVLDIPKYGTVNVHASLLPEYRGANPVQWAIINGDPVAGVTTMFTELDVDTGPMLLKAETPVDPDENALSLMMRLADLGAGILPKSLKDYAAGSLKAEPQDSSKATHARKLEKSESQLDWSQPAQKLHDKIRGQQPWPGATTEFEGQAIKIHQTRSPKLWDESSQYQGKGRPGDVLEVTKTGLVVQTGDGPLLITMLQPPGKPKMQARDWANGALIGVESPRFVSVETVVSGT